MSEKPPLHVQVAEALGCKPRFEHSGLRAYVDPPDWWCWCENREHQGRGLTLGRYDTDWSTTGPLIERYEMWVQPCAHDGRETHWVAMSNADDCDADAEGPTPLIAVCTLLLALKAAGKLPMSEDKP